MQMQFEGSFGFKGVPTVKIYRVMNLVPRFPEILAIKFSNVKFVHLIATKPVGT